MTGPSTLAGALVAIGRATWPEGDADAPVPALPGFVASPFGPIIADVADRCLRPHYGSAPVPPERGLRTAIVLVTRYGDMATEEAVVGAVDAGRAASPLLFFQSVPSAVLGVVASRWGLGGPVIVISPTGDPLAEGTALAEVLVEGGDTDEVLLVLIDLAAAEGETDRAEALLVAVGPPPAGDLP